MSFSKVAAGGEGYAGQRGMRKGSAPRPCDAHRLTATGPDETQFANF